MVNQDKRSSTHISPAAHHIQHITPSYGEIHDAAVDGFGGTFGGQVFLGYLHPAEGAYGEADGPAAAAFCDVAPGWVAPPPAPIYHQCG